MACFSRLVPLLWSCKAIYTGGAVRMCSLRSSRYASMMRILLQRDPVVAMSFRASARVLAGRNVCSPVGDPKLLPAMTFFIGHHHLFPSLFFMTFCPALRAWCHGGRDRRP